MAYGTVKVDNITFTNGGIDQTVTVSGIVQSISGNITATGTIQGATIIGTSTVSGATVTGNAGVFTTVTGGSAGFTTVTGTTVTGTTANFATLSGTTITGSVGNFGSGSAAAPSVSVGTTDNGIYSPGTDQVAISTNGTGRLFVDSSGRVGVGTGSASSVFEVIGTTNQPTYKPTIQIDATDNANPFVALHRYNGVANQWRSVRQRVVDSSGTFAIETSNAAAIGSHTWSNRLVLSNAGTLEVSAAATTAPFISYIGGTEVARIDSSGRLGLGTSSPGFFFDCQGANGTNPVWGYNIANLVDNQTNDSGLRIGSSASTTGICNLVAATNSAASQFGFYTYNGSAWGERIRIDSSGRLGVGTTSPGVRLHVFNDADSAQCKIASSSSGNRAQIEFANAHANWSTGIVGGDTSGDYLIYCETAKNIRIFTNNAERARIDASGRLLVGTSTDIGNESKIQLKDGNLNIYRASASAGAGYGIYFSTDGGATARPKAYIRVSQTAGNGGDLVFSTTADGSSSPTERMRIANDGQFNMYADLTGLQVRSGEGNNTNSYIYIGRYGATSISTGTISFGVRANGNVENQNNSYGAISDIKLKENIVDANSQWSDIKALRPVNYNLKEGQTHTQLGLIAQEVELVSPGLVSESPDRDEEGNDLGTVTKSVNYSVLYMKAVKALQEAMERIETLEAKVAALEAS